MSNPDDVIIVGAPRSGTNMLRDVLTSVPGFATWNCDEINLTWRHGNRDFPSDELRPEHATSEVRGYLQRSFDAVRRRTGARRIVEKTCANSLRVGFVQSIVPDARYLFITRDGLDAASSAVQRWHAPMDLRYTVAKAKYVPRGDLAHYGVRFLAGQWRKRTAEDFVRSPVWWGPKPHDWLELLSERPVDELAVIQWQRCVQEARRDLAGLPPEQVHHVVYEEFVRDPLGGIRSVLDFLGDSGSPQNAAVGEVSSTSVGKGRSALSADAKARLSSIAGGTLEELGYER